MLFKAFAMDRNFRSRRREGERNYSWTEEIRVVLSFFPFFFSMQNAWWRQSKHLLTYLPFHDDYYEMGFLHQCHVLYSYIAFLLAFIIFLLQRMPENYRQATMQDP